MGYVVAVGADNAGVEYKDRIKADLEADPRIDKVVDFGVGSTDDQTAYAHTAVGAARMVADGNAVRPFCAAIPPMRSRAAATMRTTSAR